MTQLPPLFEPLGIEGPPDLAPRRHGQLTWLAEKYGAPKGYEHTSIQRVDPYKSGLTPVDYKSIATPEDRLRALRIERYQRARLFRK